MEYSGPNWVAEVKFSEDTLPIVYKFVLVDSDGTVRYVVRRTE